MSSGAFSLATLEYAAYDKRQDPYPKRLAWLYIALALAALLWASTKPPLLKPQEPDRSNYADRFERIHVKYDDIAWFAAQIAIGLGGALALGRARAGWSIVRFTAAAMLVFEMSDALDCLSRQQRGNYDDYLIGITWIVESIYLPLLLLIATPRKTRSDFTQPGRALLRVAAVCVMLTSICDFYALWTICGPPIALPDKSDISQAIHDPLHHPLYFYYVAEAVYLLAPMIAGGLVAWNPDRPMRFIWAAAISISARCLAGFIVWLQLASPVDTHTTFAARTFESVVPTTANVVRIEIYRISMSIDTCLILMLLCLRAHRALKLRQLEAPNGIVVEASDKKQWRREDVAPPPCLIS